MASLVGYSQEGCKEQTRLSTHALCTWLILSALTMEEKIPFSLLTLWKGTSIRSYTISIRIAAIISLGISLEYLVGIKYNFEEQKKSRLMNGWTHELWPVRLGFEGGWKPWEDHGQTGVWIRLNYWLSWAEAGGFITCWAEQQELGRHHQTSASTDIEKSFPEGPVQEISSAVLQTFMPVKMWRNCWGLPSWLLCLRTHSSLLLRGWGLLGSTLILHSKTLNSSFIPWSIVTIFIADKEPQGSAGGSRLKFGFSWFRLSCITFLIRLLPTGALLSISRTELLATALIRAGCYCMTLG